MNFHNLLTTKRDTDYQAYLNYIQDTLAEPLPSQRVQIAQNRLVKALKAASLWTRMKTGYFFHAGSLNGACRVNLKNPATYLLTVGGSPFFYRGMGTRSSSNGYFDQPFKSDEYSGIETDLTVVQCMSNWNEWDDVALTSFSSGMRMNSAGTAFMTLYPKYNTTQGFFRHGSTEGTFTNTDSHQGIYVLTYNGTQSVLYRNGTKTTQTNSPAAPNISINRLILSLNNHATSGGVTALTFYDKYVWGDFLFDRFNDTDESTLRAILTAYELECAVGQGFTLDAASHCWFANPTALYHASSNKSWIGQVHRSPSDTTQYFQYIVEFDHTIGGIVATKLGTLHEHDDHNEPSILRRASDGRLVVAYTEHARAGSPIRWRVSVGVNSSVNWNAQQTIDPSGGVRTYTYPSIFQVTNGDIYIFYRGTDAFDAWWYYIKSTDNAATFGAETRFWDNSYLNIAQNNTNKDFIHFVGSVHANETADPSVVSHFYFNAGAGTWHKSDGTDITSLIPFVDADVTPIFTNTNPERGWFEDLILDSSGNPRVLLLYYPDITTTAEIKHRYYTEWNGSAWTTPYDMGQVMSKNIGTETLVNTYAGGSNFDPANPDRFFVSDQVGSTMEIFKMTRISHNNFEKVQITFDSQYDNWRPVVSGAPTNNVWWLSKVLYPTYMANVTYPAGYYQLLVNQTR